MAVGPGQPAIDVAMAAVGLAELADDDRVDVRDPNDRLLATRPAGSEAAVVVLGGGQLPGRVDGTVRKPTGQVARGRRLPDRPLPRASCSDPWPSSAG